MTPIRLRFASPQDADDLLAIYAPYVQHTTVSFEYDVPAHATFRRRIVEHTQQGFPWICACEESGALLGYAYAGRLGERYGYTWDAQATIYLSACAKGRHIGTALYTALIDLLTAQGYYNLYALVAYPNEVSAAFHSAMGFVEEARLSDVGYKLGRWIGLSYYCRRLRAAAPPSAPPLPVQDLKADQTQKIFTHAQDLAGGVPSEKPL